MATTHYTFYTVETDIVRPFHIKVVRNNGASEAMTAILTNKRVKAMSINKATADAIASKMATALGRAAR